MNDKDTRQQTQGTIVPKTLVRQVRRFIQDYPEVNDLFEGEETSDLQLARYIVDMVDDFNYSAPYLRGRLVTPSSLVAASGLGGVRKWIVDAASARAMKSVVNKLARNDMPYQAGNTTQQPDAVWRNLQPIVQDIELQYKQFRDDFKTQLNYDGAWGIIHSEMFAGTFDNREGYLVVQT